VQRRAFFLEREDGSARSAIHCLPAREPQAALLLLQGLGEELNKVRRALTQACLQFTEAGYAVLVLDLHGCGDSDGDFADARWSTWQADAQAGLAWLQERHPGTPVVAWGVRAGALIGSQLAMHHALEGQLWWQPSLQGKTVLQQWLRLGAANGLGHGEAQVKPAQLRAALIAGDVVDVAGYPLHPALAAELEAASLHCPDVPTLWLESSSQQPPALLPGSEHRIAGWPRGTVFALAVHGTAPWAATELEDAPELTAASLRWLQQHFPQSKRL